MKKNKASTEEIQLNTDIVGGDDLALSKLYLLYGSSIIASLKGWYAQVARKDEALILEAVNEAFWGYFNNPKTFNPEKNALKRFLEIAAERDLINILSREKKHSLKKDLPEDVELQEKFWNSTLGNSDATDSEIIKMELIDATNNELKNHFDSQLDMSLAKLVLQGERKTEVFAELLSIRKLPMEEQRAEVKRHKDRIKKVLERNDVEQKLKKLAQ